MDPLTELTQFESRKGPVVLCIMDGIACGPPYEGNAVERAYTPNLDWMFENCPGLKLKAHGTAVGMPSDVDMGNSEVGHNAIGSGRVFSQGATLVSEAIANGTLFKGRTWLELIDNCKQHNSTLHLIGLLSDGNVHSHIDHLRKLIENASLQEIRRIRIHALLDGRDVGETSALEYVDPFEDFLAALNGAGRDYRIASGGGRMKITMDRYGADWNIVKIGWDTHVKGTGRQFTTTREAIVTLREETGAIDQDIPPFVIADSGCPVGQIQEDDSVIIFNFRGDRAIELCNAFESDEFDKFDRGARLNVRFAAMTQYDSELKVPKRYLVEPPELNRTMGEFLAISGVSQLAVSETQKFGHVTYFFNGNRSGKFSEELEEYIEIPSDRVPFEQRPWMKAAEITDVVANAVRKGDYRFIRLNYPNGDMVGHTGNFQAATIAVESVDLVLSRLKSAIESAGGVLITTADHGNADEMFEWDKKTGTLKMKNGRPKNKTCHTLNPVPCYIYDPEFNGEYRLTDRTGLGISSLAATCLNFLGFRAPEDYDPSIIEL
jgi:2,3-bisphosphoglycerate-independent phosphoglycerate mutase